jgi:hypothetical protein
MSERAGIPFYVVLSDYLPGRLSVIRVEIYDPGTGVAVSAASNTGLTEIRTSTYSGLRTIPTAGEFIVRWTDTSDAEFIAEQVVDVLSVAAPPVSVVGWLPTVEDVAAYLRARTRDDEDEEDETFNNDTRPTEDQVLRLIGLAAGDLVMCAGAWLPEVLWPKAANVIALRAALMVELSFFPEQINTDQSPYSQLKELYDEDREELCGLAAAFRPPEVPGSTDEEGPPLFYFGDGAGFGETTIEIVPENETMIIRGEDPVLDWWSL